MKNHYSMDMQMIRNKMQRIVHRSFADKINDDHKNELTTSNNKEVISLENQNKQLQAADEEMKMIAKNL